MTARLRRVLARRRAARRGLAAPPPVDRAQVWIVVLNWNGLADTLTCLESLAAADLGGARVVVVDNGSRSDEAATIRARHPEATVLALDRNHGFAGGCNVGIAHALDAGADAVLLLNNDTTVDPPFLAHLVDALDAHPDAAAVAGAVLRADQPQLLDAAWLRIHWGHGLVRRLGVNALPSTGWDVVRPIPVGMGSCLLLRAHTVRAIGPLDESYFAYHEEVEWCARARAAGWSIYYRPHARIWHAGSRSTRGQLAPSWPRRWRKGGPTLENPIPLTWSPIRTYLGARNAVRFVRRYATFRREVRFWLSTAYHVPLELMALILDREEEIMLGMWTWRRALRLLCCQDVATGAEWPRDVRGWLAALRGLREGLFHHLPRELAAARAAGATAQVEEHLRGLWDGLLDRPVPLGRLGL